MKPTGFRSIRAVTAFLIMSASAAFFGAAFASDESRGFSTIRTVGPDAACQFSTIGAAIAASSDEDQIRVMTGTYNETLQVFSMDLDLIGGYPDCVLGSAPTGRSTLDQEGGGLSVDIFYPSTVADPLREVILENWVFTNGGGIGDFVGGVIVEGQPGRLAVELNNVEIRNNVKTGMADNGAGLRIRVSAEAVNTDPFGPLVQIGNDSAIVNNSTPGQGGGIYCQSQFDVGVRSVLRIGSALILANEAQDGGGVALNGCKNAAMYSGGPVVLFFPTGGIIGNTASRNGGGIYLANGAEMTIQGRTLGVSGDPDEAGLLSGNNAASGGAATLTGEGTRLDLRDTYVTGNSASIFGGAFRVINDATLDVLRLGASGPCQEAISGGGVLSRPPCSIIENNTASNGGGVLSLSGTATADFERSIIRNNDAPSGAIAEVGNLSIDTGPPSVLRMRSVLMQENTGGAKLNAEFNGIIQLRYTTVVDHDGTFGVASSPAGGEALIDVVGTIFNGNANLFSSVGSGISSVIGDCILSDVELVDSGFDSAMFYSVADPLFVDRPNEDFHLGPQSPAIDYCDNSGAPLRGIDNVQRGAPWDGPPRPAAPNAVPGDFDLGAYVGVFEPLLADLLLDVTSPGFVGGGQSTIEFAVTVQNQGPETAFGDHSVLDDLVVPALSSRSWTCSVPAGSSCTPSSGSGRILANVGNLAPGESAVFSVLGTLVDPDTDQSFSYGASTNESVFTDDPNLFNNNDDVVIQVGLFADGFESAP